MATAMKKCKVCGNEYEYCHTAKHSSGVFRWQDVACCEEHGSIYLSKIIASRSAEPLNNNTEDDINNLEPVVDIDEDEYDELFDEDFNYDDDDDEEEILIEG